MNPHLNLRVGDLTLNSVGRVAEFDGDRVELTPRQFDLLATLAAEPGRRFTAAELARRIWSNSEAADPEGVVRMTMKRLRAEFVDASFLVGRIPGGYSVIDTTEAGREEVETTLGPYFTRGQMRRELPDGEKIIGDLTLTFPWGMHREEQDRWNITAVAALQRLHRLDGSRDALKHVRRDFQRERKKGVTVTFTTSEVREAVAA